MMAELVQQRTKESLEGHDPALLRRPHPHLDRGPAVRLERVESVELAVCLARALGEHDHPYALHPERAGDRGRQAVCRTLDALASIGLERRSQRIHQWHETRRTGQANWRDFVDRK